jgi:hypothetical protein
MFRAAALLLLLGSPVSAWVESAEFPWPVLPRETWEARLVWLKEAGIARVFLPAGDPARIEELARILKRLDLSANLEGAVPPSLEPFRKLHGGPFADPVAGGVRISVLAPDSLARVRKLLLGGKPSVVWTDVFDTLGPAGYKAGAVGFAGQERTVALNLRRSAQLSRYWGEAAAASGAEPGAAARIPLASIGVEQFQSRKGASLVTVSNAGPRPWTGDLKATGHARKSVVMPSVSVPARDTVWLPVNIPLMAGPLCKDCTAFATVDHLVYATAELTAMEYENGVLAMEFSAPDGGEALLQLSREPSGPYVAGGKPGQADWDEKTQRVRLPIPRGRGPASKVRVALAIEAPDATAFFDNARVLLVGEDNRLVANFSSEAIAARSRLRTLPDLAPTREAAPDAPAAARTPLQTAYHLRVPEACLPGDWVDLAIEADGSQMSHVRAKLLRPVEVRFSDAISVRLASGARLPLSPAAIPVNQRGGRDVGILVRNNAPEIRTFRVRLEADGLEFSPDQLQVTVGASAEREVSFRVFTRGAAAGVHTGKVRLGGQATAEEPVRFLVVPPSGGVAYTANGFSFLESAKVRAAFWPGRWLEWINKDNGQSAIPAGGNAFSAGVIEARGDALVVGPKSLRLQDLEAMLPAPPVPAQKR